MQEDQLSGQQNEFSHFQSYNHTFNGTGLIMNPIARNILAAICGFVVGSVVNIGLVNIGPFVVPLPEGADVSTMESLRDSMKLFTAGELHFSVPRSRARNANRCFRRCQARGQPSHEICNRHRRSFSVRWRYGGQYARWSHVVQRVRPSAGVHSNGIPWRHPCRREETSKCITSS